jgi:hypothetical protein
MTRRTHDSSPQTDTATRAGSLLGGAIDRLGLCGPANMPAIISEAQGVHACSSEALALLVLGFPAANGGAG